MYKSLSKLNLAFFFAIAYTLGFCMFPLIQKYKKPTHQAERQLPIAEHRCPEPIKEIPVPYLEKKRAIARKLAELYLQLEVAERQSKPPTPKLLVELKGIIGELDPAHEISQEEREPAETESTTSSGPLLDVCPEKFMGERFGYPFYQKGWQLQDCKHVKPLHDVVSIIVNTMEYPEHMENQVATVLSGINQIYPKVKVFLAAKTRKIKQAAKRYSNIKTITVDKGSSHGKVWNQLINEVPTPYTLVARDVVHFTWTTRIERQIRMISTTKHVAIAGGSFRNLTGHWRVGCRQTKLFNYVLQYEEGYHNSRHSCMFCDDLEGPFVAKTQLMKTFQFSESYVKEIIFEEFFLRVFRAGNLILNCPDSMYFTMDYSSDIKRNNKAIWRPLAVDIKLVRVVLVDYGVRHRFSCQDISFTCDALEVTKNFALPMCCLEQFGNAMQFFHDMSMKHNIHYEMDSGSNVATVKFNNFSPYDVDGDIFLSAYNYSFVHGKATFISQNGFMLSEYMRPVLDSNNKYTNKDDTKRGFVRYHCPEIEVEAWGNPMLSAEQLSPPELNKLSHFTKCRANNHWINCAHSPANYGRNRYGPDLLKHTQSWRMNKMNDSWTRYLPGSFVMCSEPEFHSCIDKFPTDGNIAFKVF